MRLSNQNFDLRIYSFFHYSGRELFFPASIDLNTIITAPYEGEKIIVYKAALLEDSILIIKLMEFNSEQMA